VSASTETTVAAGLERLDRRDLRAWGGFLQAHARIVRRLDAEMRAAHGLSLSAYEVLLHLGFAPERSLKMCDLAAATVLSPSGVTRAVDRLVAAGLVERRACEADHRVTYARLTDGGLELLREARPTHLAGVRDAFLGQLSRAEVETLGAVWERLGAGISGE